MNEQSPQQSKNVLDPIKTVALFDLKNGDYVADFGSGHGYFIIPLAQKILPDGKVFAIDIQRDMLDIVRTKSKIENLHNIEYIWSDLEQPQGSKLKDEYVDFVLITNALHQCDQKEAVIKEAYRVLRSNGRLALIEWETTLLNGKVSGKDEINGGFGPANTIRMSKETAVHLCTSQSFSVQQEFDAGSHHYGILFVKKPV